MANNNNKTNNNKMNQMNNKKINKYSCMTYHDECGNINLSTTLHKRICNNPDCVYNNISEVSNKTNSNINIMEIINHLKTLSLNDRCLFMVNIIKLCASDNNLAELIFRKIYDEDENFSIFGINGLSSLCLFCEIEFDRDGNNYNYGYETFFINLALEKNNRQLVDTLISFGVSLDTINIIEIENMHYTIDELNLYDTPLYKITCSNMLEYIIEKHDILNTMSSQSIYDWLVTLIYQSKWGPSYCMSDHDRILIITKIVDVCKDRNDISFNNLNPHHYNAERRFYDITSELYECLMNVLIPFLSNKGGNCCNIYYSLIISQPKDTLLLLQKVHQILGDDKYNIALYDILLDVIEDNNIILSTVLKQLSKYRGKNTQYKDKMKKEYEKIILQWYRRKTICKLNKIESKLGIELFCRYKMEDLISCTHIVNTIEKIRNDIYEEVYILETNFRKIPRDIKFLLSKFLVTEDPSAFYKRNLKTEKVIGKILSLRSTK